MPDFLLEVRSEEIPARMQAKARADLERLFAAEIAKAGLSAGEVVTYATPRRLALIARGLPDATQSVSEETKGPKTTAPPQAIEGFLRKTGLTRDLLEDRGGIWFAVIEKPGRATADVLAEAIPAIVRAFQWSKSMRWGAASASTESLRWVRPLQGIVALFGQDVVPCEVDGVLSGYQTLGHRFHHPGPITIGSADDYVEKLRACHVIVDQDERAAIIDEGAAKAAADAGLMLVEDEGLVAENAGLTEWPVPMLGRFDPAFLEVPEEVIQLTARVNQKYFVCTAPLPPAAARRAPPSPATGEGKEVRDQPSPLAGEGRLAEGERGEGLAPAFILTANIDASDGGMALVAGNEKVLAARLSDAKFFWEQDLRIPLDEQGKRLSQIVFHEKLGTVADKVERVAKLARWLCEEGIIKPNPPRLRGGGGEADGGGAGPPAGGDEVAPPLHHASAVPLPVNGEDLAKLAERAARLCKADLVTGMVGEFPELQGVMGGHLARAQGEPDLVADAIRDHYKPMGQGDDVPTAPVTVAVSLADKLDTLFSFFAVELYPTGSKDPFALRRAMIGIIATVLSSGLRLPFTKIARLSYDLPDRSLAWFLEFLDDRLKVQQREAGVRHDLIDAVFSLGGEDDLVRLLARVKALQSFIETAEGADLLAAYRRAANILKAEGWAENPPRSRGGGAGEARDGGGAGAPSDPASSHQTSPPLHHASVVPLPVNGEDSDAPLSSGKEQQIPQTGEEDPFVEVDQGLRRAIAGNPGRTEGTVPEGAAAADIALLGALDIEASKAKIAVDEERFGDAMTALSALRAPIDRFFDEVMVNDPDPAKRAFRLGLLARFRDAVHQVADFSKIEG